MKKLLLFITFSIFGLSGYSQQIATWSLIPPYPTTNDTVKLIVDSWFPSGTCDLYQHYIAPNGNTIDVSFTHCIGMLTVICNSTDSFTLGKLNAGIYNLNMFLYSGPLLGPTGCTASLSDAKAITFSVIQATSIDENATSEIQIFVRSDRTIIIRLPEMANELHFIVSDLTGRHVFEDELDLNNNQMDLNNLKPGVYLYSASTNDGRHFKGKLNLQ